MYLKSIEFPDKEREYSFYLSEKRTCFNGFYPFGVLSKRGLNKIEFAPITVLCGNNGSGKTTALNVIAQTINAERNAPYNRSAFFDDYVMMCTIKYTNRVPDGISIITSDDVFDYMLNLRSLNEGIDTRREALFEQYVNEKYTDFQLRSLDDYEKLKSINAAKSKTMSKYVKNSLNDNVREYSNGESAYKYFIEKIEENRVYLLDEPENSMSSERQLELARFIEDYARFFSCQFVISTHSPFLLSIKDALIYDMDDNPVSVKKWTQLKSVREYRDFFKAHDNEFE